MTLLYNVVYDRVRGEFLQACNTGSLKPSVGYRALRYKIE